MVVYINGVKATLVDISRLVKDIESGLHVTYHYTKTGALAFVTEN